MLFQVKVRVNLTKMAEFGQKLQKGNWTEAAFEERLIVLNMIQPLGSVFGKLNLKVNSKQNLILGEIIITRWK